MTWTLITGLIVLGIAACAVLITVAVTVAATKNMLFPTEGEDDIWSANCIEGWYHRVARGLVSLIIPIVAVTIGVAVCAIRQAVVTDLAPDWVLHVFWVESAITIIPVGVMLLDSITMRLKMTIPHRVFIVAIHVAAVMAAVGVYALILMPVLPMALSGLTYGMLITPFVILFMVRIAFINSVD